MNEETLKTMDKARHLLEAPAPQVVGDLIAEVRRLNAELERMRPVCEAAEVEIQDHSDAENECECCLCRSVEEMKAGKECGEIGVSELENIVERNGEKEAHEVYERETGREAYDVEDAWPHVGRVGACTPTAEYIEWLKAQAGKDGAACPTT